MTHTNTLPVFLGFSDAGKHPIEAIQGARQTIVAMNDLLYNYLDPNELGENPDGDVRAGIHFIFEAAAMQLQYAYDQLEAVDNDFATPGEGYPRFEAEPQDVDDLSSYIETGQEWGSPGEWAAKGLEGIPATKSGLIRWIRNNEIHKNSHNKRPRKKSGGGWEYHISCFPIEAQLDFRQRKADAQKARFHQETT